MLSTAGCHAVPVEALRADTFSTVHFPRPESRPIQLTGQHDPKEVQFLKVQSISILGWEA